MDRRNYVRNKRLFVRGARHSEVQRPPIVMDGLDYLNLDWTNINMVINSVELFLTVCQTKITD
jgi:hypothetical protein